MGSPVHWQFLAHDDGIGERWIWRCIAVDGGIEQISEPLADFGKAVLDAAKHGFRPKSNAYVVITRGWVTHYQPHGDPVSIPPESAADGMTASGKPRKRSIQVESGRKPAADTRKPGPGKKGARQGHD
jgi:hypothetical protein